MSGIRYEVGGNTGYRMSGRWDDMAGIRYNMWGIRKVHGNTGHRMAGIRYQLGGYIGYKMTGIRYKNDGGRYGVIQWLATPITNEMVGTNPK